MAGFRTPALVSLRRIFSWMFSPIDCAEGTNRSPICALFSARARVRGRSDESMYGVVFGAADSVKPAGRIEVFPDRELSTGRFGGHTKIEQIVFTMSETSRRNEVLLASAMETGKLFNSDVHAGQLGYSGNLAPRII